jgi:hypothetical protein
MKRVFLLFRGGVFICFTSLFFSCETGTRQVSEAEYQEFLKWKKSNESQPLSMAPPTPSSNFYNPIDSARAHCLIKTFYEDKNDYLRVMTSNGEYEEMKSFHFDKASMLNLIGSAPGQGDFDGIRFYFGEEYVDSLPVHSIIMVGTKLQGTYSDGVAMYNNVRTAQYYDFEKPCPNWCSNDPAMTGEDIPLIFSNTNCPTGSGN